MHDIGFIKNEYCYTKKKQLQQEKIIILNKQTFGYMNTSAGWKFNFLSIHRVFKAVRKLSNNLTRADFQVVYPYRPVTLHIFAANNALVRNHLILEGISQVH